MEKTNPRKYKRVLIDIKHPAQLNLFSGLARSLRANGWDVTISYLNRGKIPLIIRKEFPGFTLMAVGASKGTRWSIIWQGNIKRTMTFLKLLLANRYNICVAASSVPLALACRLTGTPIIQFYDDPERKRINAMNARMSTQLFFPPIVSKTDKISIFNCLKEWSYLSPKRFTPDPSVLADYGLKPNQYVFVREVSNKSFNYFNQEDAIVAGFSRQIRSDIKVVLSLEDKTMASRYPAHWKILEEPVADIHSLIYYSKLLVSSGDSMAREAAMLGVPSIYCGIRTMKANQLLIDLNILAHHPGNSALELINSHISKVFDLQEQMRIRSKLLDDWDDMVIFMEDQVNHYKKAN
ncbi:MAG: DUF354 domain-containing protein [Chitinophagaceae bacterium]